MSTMPSASSVNHSSSFATQGRGTQYTGLVGVEEKCVSTAAPGEDGVLKASCQNRVAPVTYLKAEGSGRGHPSRSFEK